MSEPWVHISKITPIVKQYIEDRRTGVSKSLVSGYNKLDTASIGGFEWGSTITIGGRPSIGKTAFSDCLISKFFLNNEDNFNLLDFNWEMSAQSLLIRHVSSELKRSYGYILSAENNIITDLEKKKADEVLDRRASLPIYFVEKPQTTTEFSNIVRRFRDKFHNRKLLVRVDHTILAKISQEDGDRVSMLLNLLGNSNEIKREGGDVIFLFLTQMNREFETRQENGSDKAFPLQGDVFGGDAAAMYSEMMILLNRPSKYRISYYGKSPNGITVSNDDIFAHIVKSRNSKPNQIIRFKENFENMSMIET